MPIYNTKDLTACEPPAGGKLLSASGHRQYQCTNGKLLSASGHRQHQCTSGKLLSASGHRQHQCTSGKLLSASGHRQYQCTNGKLLSASGHRQHQCTGGKLLSASGPWLFAKVPAGRFCQLPGKCLLGRRIADVEKFLNCMNVALFWFALSPNPSPSGERGWGRIYKSFFLLFYLFIIINQLI